MDNRTAARLLFPALRWSADTGFDHERARIERALELGVGGFILFARSKSLASYIIDGLDDDNKSAAQI